MSDYLKYIFLTVKDSFFPACFLALGIIYFYSYYPYESLTNTYLHIVFYALSAIALPALFFLNNSKLFLTLITGIFSYLLLNNIKIITGENFVSSFQYIWLCFLWPLNLALFYFFAPAKLKKMRNFYLFVFMLAETAFVSKFGDIILQVPYLSWTVGIMPVWAVILWISVLFVILISISIHNTIINIGLFYAGTAIFLGLIYANSASACTTFFMIFSLILCVSMILDLRFLYCYDHLSDVGSYQSYLNQARKKFPFKYTIGLLCIDNREKVLQKTNQQKLKGLEQAIVDKIKEFPYEIEIFRHKQNELILVFKNETAKHVIDYADEIRRSIAGTEFVFYNKETLKITVSICVSEKTRKDLDAAEVINRAHITLQKANALNNNICMKA